MSKLILAAAAAFMLTGPVLAAPAVADNDAPTKVVSLRGADLSDPAQARQVYARLQRAARDVCQADSRAASEDFTCVRQTMRAAVGVSRSRQLASLLNDTYGGPASTAFAADAR